MNELPPHGALVHGSADTESRIRAALQSVLDRLESEHSRRSYRDAWAQWLAWCSANAVAVLDARPSHVAAWMSAGTDAGSARKTLATRLYAVRQVYASFVVHELIAANPCREVRAPRTAKDPRTPWLDEDSLARMLTAFAAPRHPRKWEWREQRNHVVLSMLAAMGPRRSELARITWPMIQPLPGGGSFIEMTVKGNKSAQLAIPETLRKILEDWRLRCTFFRDGPVFPTHENARQPISGTTVNAIVKEAAERAGVPLELATPHALRRTFATILALSGTPTRTIQAAMAHEHTSTTERYIKATAGLREAPGESILARLTRKE